MFALTDNGLSGARLIRSSPLLWMLAFSALGGAPDYDAFSNPDGSITTREQGVALMALLRDSGQLEAVLEDAEKGNARARRVFQTLEIDYLPDIGRDLAERVSQPPCLVPVVRELSGRCIPDWSFLDFLSKDKPGGARLRRALFDGFARRARQRHLENQLVLSTMNAILGVGVATAAAREAEIAAGATEASGLARASETTPVQQGAPAPPGKLVSSNPAKAIESLRTNIAEHRKKLQDYIRDPDAFDNQGLLKNAPSPEIRRKIIDSRIRNLEKEIEVFEKNIKDLGGRP